MHWETGEFHKNVLFEAEAYITPHKHLAISGNATSVYFGNRKSNTTLFGNNTGVSAEDSVNIRSVNETKIKSNGTVIIETNPVNAGILIPNGVNMLIHSNTATQIDAEKFINIRGKTGVNIASASKSVVIMAYNGLILNDYHRRKIYGPTLPSTSELDSDGEPIVQEGSIFFKLIS